MMNLPQIMHSAEFTAPGNSVLLSIPAQTIPSKYSVEVVGYDAAGAIVAPTAWDVLLLGSLSGEIFTEKSKIIEHVNTAQDNGDTVYSAGSFYPARFWQIKCKALTLGPAAKIVVRVLGIK